MNSNNSGDVEPSIPCGQTAGNMLLNEVSSSPSNSNNNNTEDVATAVHTELDALAIGEDGNNVYVNPESKVLPSGLDHYQMNNRRRGIAVIINNENFHWTTGMNKRTGTDVDAKNLNRTFKKLGFEVDAYKDTKCVKLREIVQHVAEQDHTGNDCFMCAILSHGDDGCIYGTDGIVQIKSIVNQFRGDICPSLAGKPKIFIFQACRGTQHEIPVRPAIDVVDGPTEETVEPHVIVMDSAPAPTLPSGSDFLFCYSVVEGFYSHRDTLYGSWYVQDFTSIVEKHIVKADNDASPVDFLDILTAVNRKVSERRVERSLSAASLGKKQMPCFLSMLTKKLYLRKYESKRT